MNALVVALNLEFAHTLIEHAAFDAFSGGCLNSFADDHRGLIARGRNQHVQIAHQRRHIPCREIEGGHTPGGSASAEERTEVGIAKGVDLGHDVGTGFAAGGVGSVAAGAAGFILLASRTEVLGGGHLDREDGKEEQASTGHLMQSHLVRVQLLKIPIKRDRREAYPQASSYSTKVLVRELPIMLLIGQL